nr:LipL45 protein [Leptospira sp. GIMC2001]
MIRNKLFILLVLLVMVSCGGKKSEDTVRTESSQESVQITFFSGDVKIMRDTVERKPELGMALASDDKVLTGENGKLEILVRQSGLVKVSSKSSVMVSAFMRDSDVSDTNIHIDYGKVVTIVKKEKKNENFNVVTPTLVAGVRGTTFLTSVENVNDNKKGIACGKEDCLVKVSVLDGSVAVHRNDSPEEVFLSKNSELNVPGNKKLSQDLVKPLGKNSLGDLKDIIVFHKSNIGGYENLVNELKNTSSELSALDSSGSLDEMQDRLQKSSSKTQSDEIKKLATETDESRYLKKDIAKEKIKLDPKETF